VSDQERCRVSVVTPGGFAWHVCGRKVKEDGLCGIHLRARKVREEKKRKWNDERARAKRLKDEAVELSRRLGTDVSPQYDSIRSRYTENFVVSGEWLREIASKP